MRCLTFTAAGRCCALPLQHVVETLRPRPVERVADALPFVLGLARIRGRAVTVVDLARLAFGEAGASERLVTIRAEQDRVVALAVEEVTGVALLERADQMPPLVANDVLSSVAFAGETLLVVLRAARIVERAIA